MDARERGGDRVAQALGALHAEIASFTRARLVVGARLDRVGEGRHRSTVIDLSLSTLGLELLDDARELGDLVFRQIELVREEAERTTHAERTSAEEVTGRTAVAAGTVTAVAAEAPSEAGRTVTAGTEEDVVGSVTAMTAGTAGTGAGTTAGSHEAFTWPAVTSIERATAMTRPAGVLPP